MRLSLRKVLLPVCVLFYAADTSAQGVGLEWAKHFGGTSYDQGNAIAVDKDRNVYVAGYFNQTAGFNTATPLVSNGGSDMFVAKLDWSGATQWVKQLGGSGSDAALALKLDAQNNIYITGYFSDTVDFNPGGAPYTLMAAAATDIFVAKLDSAGTVVWAKGMEGAAGGDEGHALALDAAGNVLTTGVFYGTVDFDPGSGIQNLTASGSSEVFVSKLNNNGEFVWAKRLGGSRLDSGEGIAVDSNGNVYTTGSFQRTADFDPGSNVFNLVSGANSYDVFISKLDAAGSFVWAKQFTGSNPNMGSGLALDAAANVYLTGMFTGTADFDPGTAVSELIAAGGTDIYVAKLDSAGAFVWARHMGGSQSSGDRGYSIAVDQWGNSYSTGFFSGTADFDPDPTGVYDLTAGGSSDIYVSKLSASGAFVWAKALQAATGTNWGTGIAVDPSSNVYTTGLFNGTVDFDPSSSVAALSAYGNTDAFIQKLICTDTSSAYLSITTGCNGYELNGELLTTGGMYTAVVSNSGGCDSTITLNLTITLPEAIINVNGFILGTTQPYNTYQWYLNGNLLPGATGNTYTVQANGNYTVAVTDSFGCTDTSDIYVVSNVTSIGSRYVSADQVSIYPNPAQHIVYIKSPVAVDVTLTSIEGRIIREVSECRSINIAGLAKGIYLLRIKDKEGHVIRTDKVVKQ